MTGSYSRNTPIGLIPAWDFLASEHDRPVSGWLVAEPTGAVLTPRAGDVVLGMAADVRSALRWLAETAAANGAGLVLRHPGPAVARRLATHAEQSGVALYWLDENTSWADLIAELADVGRGPLLVADDGLAALAQTIALLTGGLVSIEDPQSRVLAYSSSTDEVDDLRRLSILGRSGPADYLALLARWGIYDRLAVPDEVVDVAAHPETGIRRRLAVGVFAGTRQLGTIWVQQLGETPFAEHAGEALRGAARLVAEHLVGATDRATGATAGNGPAAATDPGRNPARRRDGADTLRRLFARQADAASELGRSADSPCIVLALDPGVAADDPAAHRMALRQIAELAAVQGASLRAGTVVEVIGTRVYALLPALSDATAALRVVAAVTIAGREHGYPALRGAAGPMAPDVLRAAGSRAGADLVLDRPTDPSAAAEDFGTVRPRLVLDRATSALDDPLLDDVATVELVRRHREIAATVLAYLDRGSDVTATADHLGLHATTIRYRLRRAQALTGYRLGDPARQLALHLQLRAALGPEAAAAPEPHHPS